MAVPHLSVAVVARGSGRSAVLSAAYRHCAKMEFEREARTIDYRAKQGLLHEEFVIPGDAPPWLRMMIAERSVAGASEAFWNRVEDFERRSDAQLAKDVTIALPVELTSEQNIALVRDFVERHVSAKGMVADWVYHNAPGNPHVHLMTTLRPLAEDGFGSKRIPVAGPDGKSLRSDAGKIVYELWAGSVDDFNSFRDGWFSCLNTHLALAGLDTRLDGRSFEKQGIDLAPTIHIGVGAKAIERKSAAASQPLKLERIEIQEQRRAENTARIVRRPEIVLDIITREKSVFDERDVAKILHRYIDDQGLFRSLMARILHSPEALRLDRERIDFATGVRVPARYTTRELVLLEAGLVRRTVWLASRSSHGIRNEVLAQTLARYSQLSLEQRTAIAHIADCGRIATVIGRAGAGKTTMMKAAREAWEAAGYRVVGGALAGKAAEGLEKEAGILSRTLSSWELRWSEGCNQLDDKTVFVLDEAGMVASRQMALFVAATAKAGAKLVLVGDPEQLQPIEAGAAFRAITNRIGYTELEKIYRQREPWMRDASLDLAHGNVGRAVEAYRANGRIVGSNLKAEAIERLIADWSKDYDPSKTDLILAHLRRDVRTLNEMARSRLVERGIVAEGFSFKTEAGTREFSAGDQIVFLKNEGGLGVKNGMLAKVVDAAPGRIVAEISVGEHVRRVIVEQRFYSNVDHGYATTVHKSQGTTVDRVKVLASLSLDRHLTYVAMTRHREDLAVYFGQRSFEKSGGLVPVLSRKNTKETTLDYENGLFYRHALRFAESRGLHLMKVARTLVRDQLQWTIRQKTRLAELGTRLAAIAAKLGFNTIKEHSDDYLSKEAMPMVSGITSFPKPIAEAIQDRLKVDAALVKQWEDVSMRFRRVYANPEAACRAIHIDAVIEDEAAAKTTLARLAAEPKSFGALRGKTGVFASRTERQDRERAELNIPALAQSIANYLRQRGEVERRAHAQELRLRRNASIVIPALSPIARQVLEMLRDAIDRNNLPAVAERALNDKRVKSELEGFARAISDRFGERTFLGLAARDPSGEAFKKLAENMPTSQAREVRMAWSSMRTAQQLAAYQRTIKAQEQTETLRQTKSPGLSLK